MAANKKISLRDRILNVLVLVVIAAFVLFVWNGIEKNRNVAVPDGAVELEFPLSGGDFYIAQSGPGSDFSGDVHTSPDEKYAVDIIKDTGRVDLFGSDKLSLDNDPSFGVQVFSPCTGQVVWTHNDTPDPPPGKKNPGAVANSVTIDCGGFNVIMAHFKQYSVVVNTGDQVKAGDPIAAVGNSGNSTGPHLHIMAVRENSGGSDAMPLPMLFGGRYLQKGDTVSR